MFRIALAASLLMLSLIPCGAQSLYVVPPSSLGMNLTNVTQEMPLLNVLKLAGGWYPENSSGVYTGEESLLYSSFLDVNHYPTSLTTGGLCPGGSCPSHTFTQTSGYIFDNGYPPGTYVLLWGGTGPVATAGTLAVGDDGSATCNTSGRCIVTVASTTNKIKVTIKTTDPNNIGNYINNIALIYAPDSTSSHVGVNETNFLAANCMTQVSGACFNPLFLTLMMPFKTLRFMDWGYTVSNSPSTEPGNISVNWTDRSLVGWAFWNENNINFTTTGNQSGYPVEVMIALANTLHANAWLNMPCLSTQAYVQSEANLVAATLNPGLKVYPEFCNEVWNNGALTTTVVNGLIAGGESAYPLGGSPVWASGTTYSSGQVVYGTASATLYTSLVNGNVGNNPATDGGVHWQNTGSCPTGGTFSGFSYLFSFGILQAVLDNAIFYNTLGPSRVIRTMGSQGPNTARVSYQLTWLASNCGGNGSLFSGTAAQNMDVLAVAPYFANVILPAAWTAQADGGLTDLFTEQNSGGILPDAVVTGNCGNGAGKTCDSGGNTAFTITTGLSLPSTPINGTCIGVTFNAANGTLATLTADGGSPFPLEDAHGNALAANAVGSGTVTALCFTNATSAGSVTSAWREATLGFSGGWIAEAVSFWTQDAAIATANGVGLVAYESGQSYNGNNDAVYDNWYTNAMRDPRMGTSYTSYYAALRAQAPLTSTSGLINVFADIGPFGAGEQWEVLETIQSTSSPRYDASKFFTNFLLKRDLDPASNDNSPVGLNEAA